MADVRRFRHFHWPDSFELPCLPSRAFQPDLFSRPLSFVPSARSSRNHLREFFVGVGRFLPIQRTFAGTVGALSLDARPSRHLTLVALNQSIRQRNAGIQAPLHVPDESGAGVLTGKVEPADSVTHQSGLREEFPRSRE